MNVIRARGESCGLVPLGGKVINMRDENTIVRWERRFEDRVWYSRHVLRSNAIERGDLILVGDACSASQRSLPKAVWERACARACRIELAEDVGPCSDYEWGKINGKLSALRWVLGLEWDMLDT